MSADVSVCVQEAVVKMSLPTKPTSDLKSRLAPQAQLKRMPPDEARMLSNFVDLLDKTLDLDPAKRILPKDALSVSALLSSFLTLNMG